MRKRHPFLQGDADPFTQANAQLGEWSKGWSELWFTPHPGALAQDTTCPKPVISPIYTPFQGLFFAFQLKHSGLLNLPHMEELGQKPRVRIRGLEQDMRESGGLRTGRE